MPSTKKQKTRYADFDQIKMCTLKEVAHHLQTAITKYGEDAVLSIEISESYGDVESTVEITYKRDETEQEELDRLSRERNQLIRAHDKDLAEFKRLSDKFKGKL